MRNGPPVFLDVEIRELAELRVIHRLLVFHENAGNPDKVIRKTFQELRWQVSRYGLDPGTLIHLGIPEIIDDELVSYDCCIEFPLPETDFIRLLPGGRYAVLTVEKTPAKIGPAIRYFRGDYLPDRGLIVDVERPVYEVYFKDTLEFCLPIW